MLFNTAYLSDVGCTLRVISRERAADILDKARSAESAFGLEMVLLAVIRRSKVVQVPGNYHPRLGTSSVTGDVRKTIVLGLMMRMVVRYRVIMVKFRK